MLRIRFIFDTVSDPAPGSGSTTLILAFYVNLNRLNGLKIVLRSAFKFTILETIYNLLKKKEFVKW